MLTTFDESDDIHRAIQAGAIGYLVKAAPPAEVLRAIHAAHAGERYLPAPLEARLAKRPAIPELTNREQEILQKMVEGFSNKEIAAALFIAEVTVNVHARHVFRKLKVADRTQAVAVAIHRGLVRLDGM